MLPIDMTKEPPTKQEIQEDKAHKVKKLALRTFLQLSATIGTLAILHHILRQYPCLADMALLLIVPAGIFIYVTNITKEHPQLILYDDIEPLDHHRLIEWCLAHETIRTYEKKVASQGRQLTRAELATMEQYARNQPRQTTQEPTRQGEPQMETQEATEPDQPKPEKTRLSIHIAKIAAISSIASILVLIGINWDTIVGLKADFPETEKEQKYILAALETGQGVSYHGGTYKVTNYNTIRHTVTIKYGQGEITVRMLDIDIP